MRAAFAPMCRIFLRGEDGPARSSATGRLSRRTRISATTCCPRNSFMAIWAAVSARRTRPAGLRSQGIKSGHQGSFRPDQGIPYLHLGLAARSPPEPIYRSSFDQVCYGVILGVHRWLSYRPESAERGHLRTPERTGRVHPKLAVEFWSAMAHRAGRRLIDRR